MTQFNADFMQRTIKLAQQSITDNGGPFAALVVQNNKIIAAANNQVTLNHDPTAHAEIMAIRQACSILKNHELKDCILYTSSEPCPMCLAAIYWAGIAEVIYANPCQEAASAGFDDSFIYREIALPHQDKSINIQQCPDQSLIERAKTIFKLWGDKEDKILY